MDQAAVEPEVSSEVLRERMIRKRKAIDLMELSFAEDAARFAATDEYDELGFVSPIDWIRFNCHMTSGAAADEADQVHERRLSLSTWIDGSMVLSGVLDAFGGAALRAALEPLAHRSGDHDRREREQRLADALVELASGGTQRPSLQVTTSIETLLGLAGAAAADMEFSLPISTKIVERLACDCNVTRVLLDSESSVIDVGRAKRVVSGPARRALNARDGSCRWPGCDRPASWTAAHHVVHWVHGGTTDLDNLILLCHRHHWMVHEGKWQLVRSDDGRMLAIPPTVRFGPSARDGTDYDSSS